MTHPASPAAYDGTLYVGANYHPHDLSPDEWVRDLDLMASAGFRVVRVGHLAWDSYEPRDGEFTFDWFDEFLEAAIARDIRVILDIAVRPAPLWLHRKHPSIDVVNVHGKREYANSRYLEDVGDPAYMKHALRFADALTSRYAGHRAILAFGIDNEPGSGPYSYSPTVRARFIEWLRKKYRNDVDEINRAWAGQRWSRRVSDFDEVDLPRSGFHSGPLERMIDFRTFVSDEIVAAHSTIVDTVAQNAPGALITGNQWYFVEGEDGRFFDYAPIAYSGRISRGGGGMYPHNSQRDKATFHHSLSVIARIQLESPTPYWATETTTETAIDGAVRKSAYASLLYGNQMMCGWTWQSHHAGEERFLQGQLDWDGVPNRKYNEYARIAREFRQIEQFGLPRLPRAEVAIAFSFSSQLASASFPELHDRQLDTVFSTLLERNIDVRMVDLELSALDYRLLILPGTAVLSETTVARVRAFVQEGGTVVMTAYSGWMDEHGQIVRTARPHGLDDVFGIRLGSFREPAILNEASAERTNDEVLVEFSGTAVLTDASRLDEIDVSEAEVLGHAVGVDDPYPIVTANTYGRGRAIYVGIPARAELLDAVLAAELSRLDVRPDLDVPRGILARRTDDTHALLVNVSQEALTIDLPAPATSVLTDRRYAQQLTLKPMDADFVAFE